MEILILKSESSEEKKCFEHTFLMSSSEAFLNSFSKGLANSLNKPTSSQFFKNRVGVGVWSEKKCIKPPQFYFTIPFMNLLVLNSFQNTNKQEETRRWLGTLGLHSAPQGGSWQANSTCWRPAPGACRAPDNPSREPQHFFCEHEPQEAILKCTAEHFNEQGDFIWK